MKFVRHATITIAAVLLTAGLAVLLITNISRTASAGPVERDGIDLLTQQPFQKNVTVTLTAGQAGVNVGIDVPTGKLYVIEQVSLNGSAPSDQIIEFSLMSHIAPDYTNRSHYLSSERQISNSVAYYRATHPVRIYADTPYVYARVSRSASPDTVTFRFTVSGYLIDK